MESLNIGELKRKALDVIKSSEYWMFAVNANSLPRLNALLLYTGADALKTFLLAPVSRGINLFGIEKSRLTLEELNHVLDEEVRANSDIIFLGGLDAEAIDFWSWLTDSDDKEMIAGKLEDQPYTCWFSHGNRRIP
jgi:hypothetical protein